MAEDGPTAESPDSEQKSSESEEEKLKRKRKRRDPFKDFPVVSSGDAGLRARELSSLSEIKRIRRARVRHEGKRVVTDDVKKLKSLSIEPRLSRGEYINYYVEPVRIEYYIPKDSRFAVETKYLYIPLVDPVPREDDQILQKHMQEDRFIDLIEIMNEYPQYITDIMDSYNNTMDMYESLSAALEEAYQGKESMLRTAFYLTEVLMDYEPTVAALEFLGPFQIWNLNWMIRQLNTLGLEFAAADKTISFLIKMRNIHWEEQGLPYDERFEILAALFYEQAFPNRGALVSEEDFFMDVFKKSFRKS